MRILVDGTPLCYVLTGIGQYTYGLLTALAKERPDWEFHLCSPYPTVVPMVLPNVIPMAIGQRNQFRTGWRAWWFDRVLPKLASDLKPDYFWGTSGLVPFRLRGTDVALTVYDFTPERFPETMSALPRLYRHTNLKYWLKRSSLLLPISRFTANEMCELYGARSSAVLYPGLDSVFLDRPPGQSEASDYLVALGTLEPRKNLGSLLDAMDTLTKAGHWPANTVLKIVGAKGWRDKAMLSKIDRLERLGLVERLGYLPRAELPTLLARARALLMPSLYEGFGMPILEAVSVGCPIVCSDIPPFHEIMGDQPAMYHGVDKASIQDSLLHLLKSPGMPPRPTPGSEILERFSWTSSAKIFIDTLTGSGHPTAG